MKNSPLLLLFDADMVVFEACSNVEQEIYWGEGLWTLHSDQYEAQNIIDSKVQSLTNKVLSKLNHDGAYEIIMCFSDDLNFRKKLYPLYMFCYRDWETDRKSVV